MIASDRNTILIEEELNRVGALINSVYRDFEWERSGAIIDNILKRNGGVVRQAVFHELEDKRIFLRENCGRIKPVTLKNVELYHIKTVPIIILTVRSPKQTYKCMATRIYLDEKKKDEDNCLYHYLGLRDAEKIAKLRF